MGILVTEDAESVKWLFETFKNMNPSIMFRRLVVAEKGMNEREMINVVLPPVKVVICLYHTLRTLTREMTICLYHTLRTFRREMTICLYHTLRTLRREMSICLYHTLRTFRREMPICLEYPTYLEEKFKNTIPVRLCLEEK